MHPYAIHAPPLAYQPLITTTQQQIEHSLNSLQLKLQQRRILNPVDTAASSEQLLRLQQLRRERQAINSQQAMFSSLPPQPLLLPTSVPPPPPIPKYDLSYDEDELLKQYQDGTRAQLYYQDIANKKPTSSVPPALLNHESAKAKNWDTPYDMLAPTAQVQPRNSPPKEHKAKFNSLVKQLQPVFEEQQGRSLNRSPSPDVQLSPLRPKPISTRQQSPIKSYRGSSPIKLRRTSNNRSTSAMKRHKSVGKVTFADKELPRPAGDGQSQLTVLKLVENRLRVAQVAYQDPRYNRQQEEMRQLINTYQIEERQRNQLKSTLTKHPKVLHKYPFLL